MSHVSHETAKRLQDAGFPQPVPLSLKFGQFIWVIEDCDGIVTEPELAAIFEDKENSFCVTESGAVIHLVDLLKWIFAPTAEDILLQLPDGHALTRANQSMFICMKGEPVIGENGCHNNAAEAAAIDWFDTKGIESRWDWTHKKLQAL